MHARLAAAAIVCVVVGTTGCAGPSTVEASVRDAFVDCMAEEGFPVENVEVGVGDGRHIESFSWDPEEGDVPAGIGQGCEDEALSQFQVSRT